jgi:hypothetical protein
MHAVARLALHLYLVNIQTSWAKIGRKGAAACLQGANDLGGTLMNGKHHPRRRSDPWSGNGTRGDGGAYLIDQAATETVYYGLWRGSRGQTFDIILRRTLIQID